MNHAERYEYLVNKMAAIRWRGSDLDASYDNNRKLRSGTGQTVNYALKQNLRIIFLHPDTAEIS